MPLLLTIFDQTMAEQVAARGAEHAGDLARRHRRAVAGRALHRGARDRGQRRGRAAGAARRRGDGELGEEPVPQLKAHRVEALARALFTPYDKSAGLLLYGAIGLVAVFLIETITAIFVLDNSIVDAIYGSAKTLVTVDPNLDVDNGPGWYKLFTSVTMLVALVFVAGFTAGLVNRVVDRRLTGLVGRRAVPRRDHVVVVGLGQVGMRLCLLLRGCGDPGRRGRAGRGRRQHRPRSRARAAGGDRPRLRPLADGAAVAAPGAGGRRRHLATTSRTSRSR